MDVKLWLKEGAFSYSKIFTETHLFDVRKY